MSFVLSGTLTAFFQKLCLALPKESQAWKDSKRRTVSKREESEDDQWYVIRAIRNSRNLSVDKSGRRYKSLDHLVRMMKTYWKTALDLDEWMWYSVYLAHRVEQIANPGYWRMWRTKFQSCPTPKMRREGKSGTLFQAPSNPVSCVVRKFSRNLLLMTCYWLSQTTPSSNV